MKYTGEPRRRALEYEKALVEWWKKNKVFEKSVEQRPAHDSYVFYDGPPFITGNPHHGTLLSSIVKDAVPRFWTMRGKRVERRWGWDCHGLPAENFVEKQLGITDRRQIGAIPMGASEAEAKRIEKEIPGAISLETYITKARESMVANSETWEGTIDRVGRWVDFKGAYRTMDKNFMESVWWAFKQLFEAGKIYEGRKVLMYDTKFATPVSKAEVTMDNDAYQIVTDPSVFVRFSASSASADALLLHGTTSAAQSATPASLNKLENRTNEKPVYLLAWTTTPWTLPANIVLAVNPEMEYGAYEQSDGIYIVAKELAPKVLHEELKLVKSFKGAELKGLKYEPLFNLAELVDGAKKSTDRGSDASNKEAGEVKNVFKKDTFSVVTAKFVSNEDGTGIVHCAPAYGEDDYGLMSEYEIDFADVLDEKGYYLSEMAKQLHELGVRDTDENGIENWAGNKFIAKVLEEKGVVYEIKYIEHEYPFNPRSKQRIMYRAFPSWFFDVQGSKPLMLAENENINWFPAYLKHGRFAKNIEQAPDWNLSRDRFWATAMPVWKSEQGTMVVMGSYAELKEYSGVELEDYHRPWVDEIEFDAFVSDSASSAIASSESPVRGSSTTSTTSLRASILPCTSSKMPSSSYHREHFKRIEKVLDCWFESGSMPFAQLHYPFENKEKFEANYPADFIVEYVGQVRAWFYYLHVVNTALAEIGAFGATSSKNSHSVEKKRLNAFDNVITTGTLAGNDGRKMSKSLGNYTDPNELMDKFSADSLRFLLLSSPVLAGEDFALLDKDVSDTARKLSMVWNVYDFFNTYASVDNIDSGELEKFSCEHASENSELENALFATRPAGPSSKTPLPRSEDGEQARVFSRCVASSPRAAGAGTRAAALRIPQKPHFSNSLDIWIISRIHQLRDEITEGMEAYDLPRATAGILPFIDDLSNWFVRRSRRRFWKSEDDDDKLEAYATLYYILTYLAKIMAPFTPFLAEELYQNMTVGGVKNAVITATGEGKQEADDDKTKQETSKQEWKGSVHLLDWPEAGEIDEEVLAKMAQARAIITEGLALRMQKSETEQQIKVRQPLAKLTYGGEKLPEEYEKMIADEVNVKKVVHGSETKLDKKLTDVLKAEGFARELIRAVQAARKKAGLNVDDRIRLATSAELAPEWLEMVKAETLAEEYSKEGNYRYDEIAKVDGRNVTISLEKV